MPRLSLRANSEKYSIMKKKVVLKLIKKYYIGKILKLIFLSFANERDNIGKIIV